MIKPAENIVLPKSITLPYLQAYETPFGEEALDQFPSSLPRYFIEQFSVTGAHVFDPFMGFGTSAFTCEDMGRIPYGIEADEERHGWAAGQLSHWQNVICADAGDIGDIGDLGFPMMDLCVTSPPWMEKDDDWNPLYGGDPDYAGYDQYLARLGEIFYGIKTIMKNGAFVIIHVQDVDDTPLCTDFQQVISRHFAFVSCINIAFTGAPNGFDHTQCLVFKND